MPPLSAEHAWNAGHHVDWSGVTILDLYFLENSRPFPCVTVLKLSSEFFLFYALRMAAV